MVAHSKSYVVLVALAGGSPELSSGINEAVRLGMSPVVVTDHQQLGRVRQSLTDGGVVDDVRLLGVRRLPLDGLRRKARTLTRRVPRAAARRIRRLLVGAARRLTGQRATSDRADKLGHELERLAAAGSDRLSSAAIEPAITNLGLALSRLRQSRGALRIVADHARMGRVLGVVCMDGPSLLPGWLVGRRYKILPVLTSFPTDWDESLIAQLEVMETGTRW